MGPWHHLRLALYRGFPTRRPHDCQSAADWKSAIRQIGNLRYVAWSMPFPAPMPQSLLDNAGRGCFDLLEPERAQVERSFVERTAAWN